MERVRSIVFDVEGDDGGGTVIVRESAGTLRTTCSCGTARLARADMSDPLAVCAHARAALALVPDLAAGRTALAFGGGGSGSGRPPSGPPSSGARHSPAPPQAGSSARPNPILVNLRVLIEALLRAAAGEVTTAVDEALHRSVESLASQPFPGVARVLARVASALGSRGTTTDTALAITALGEVAVALEGTHGIEVRAEITGAGPEIARVDDLELIEVARVRERGPISWETRLLVDPNGGTLYREEGLAGARSLSTGICGRRLHVSLASRTASRDPPRIVLMHYQLEPTAPDPLLRRTIEAAQRSLALPADLRAAPLLGVACPRTVWVAPKSIDVDRRGAVIADAAGNELVLDRTRDAGALDALGELLDAGGTVCALGGAYVVDADGIRMQPWSALVERSRGIELVALAV